MLASASLGLLSQDNNNNNLMIVFNVGDLALPLLWLAKFLTDKVY